jgi:predicted deacylase
LPERTYKVELSPPVLAPYREGNTGIDFMNTLDSGRPGPHLMVNALTHGNELCGAIAVDFLYRAGFKPARGKVTLGFANVAAFARFRADDPTISRFVEQDFNRVWDEQTLDGPHNSIELARAREIRPLIDQIDHLLDIHSMQHATAPLMLSGLTGKSLATARRVGVPVFIMRDQGHASGRRLLDYAAFSDETSPKTALLVECGQHWEQASARVAQDTTLRFLDAFDMLDADFKQRHGPHGKPAPQRVIEVTEAVTIRTPHFAFVEDFIGMEVVPEQGTLIGMDGHREIRTPYPDCVLIMPSRRLTKGQTAVRLGRFAP